MSGNAERTTIWADPTTVARIKSIKVDENTPHDEIINQALDALEAQGDD